MSDIVRTGYDEIADRYAAWRSAIEGSPELEWVEALLSRLPDHPDVLELGCGQAAKPTRLLAERGRLIGVDISREQLRRARKSCPGDDFREADITAVDFDPESFDAVVSIYVFNHVPRADLPRSLRGSADGCARAGTCSPPSVARGRRECRAIGSACPCSSPVTPKRRTATSCGWRGSRSRVTRSLPSSSQTRAKRVSNGYWLVSPDPPAAAALPRRDGDLGLDERGRPSEERRPSASRELDEGPAECDRDEADEDECDEERPRHVLHRT